ncbi:MAG: multiprotein bridging factor aMBF1 [Candidatus Methanosuratincola sp.]
MNCEICGKKIVGFPARISIEQSVLLVCQDCSKFGTKIDRTTARKLESTSPKPGPKKLVVKPQRKERFEEFILVENYGELIRKSRENAKISREELAKRLGEKESVIRRIESGEMYPTAELTVKLERLLKIKLKATVERVESGSKPTLTSVTLGDVAILKDSKS